MKFDIIYLSSLPRKCDKLNIADIPKAEIHLKFNNDDENTVFLFSCMLAA